MKQILVGASRYLRKKLLRSGPDDMSRNPRYRQYKVGKWTYGSPDVFSWGEGAVLEIGRYCSIAPDVTILLGGEHRVDWITTYPFNVRWKSAQHYTGHPSTKGDVIIGNDVWIGKGALILSGVTIGDGAVIGANSVVSKDISPYAIAVGNPACQIRLRFLPEEIEALEKIAWWNWQEDQIEKALPLLLSGEVSAFIEKYHIP